MVDNSLEHSIKSSRRSQRASYESVELEMTYFLCNDYEDAYDGTEKRLWL